jgi:hypothetical protein
MYHTAAGFCLAASLAFTACEQQVTQVHDDTPPRK